MFIQNSQKSSLPIANGMKLSPQILRRKGLIISTCEKKSRIERSNLGRIYSRKIFDFLLIIYCYLRRKMQMSNNILSIIRNKNPSTSELIKVVAGNVRAMRLRRNISQKDFASKVGIALPTYRRFESTGEISLSRLIEIAKFFDVAGDFKNLFTKREYSSIEEVISERKPRRRASRK